MSSNWATMGLAIGLALAGDPGAAFAGEPFFLEVRPAVEYEHPSQRATGIASLGQRLFFDTRLSRSGMTACASCHRPEYAFAEPSPVSVSDNGSHGQRNAPSLINVGVLPALMWDGRLHTLEQQALSPFRRGEMGLTVEDAETRLNMDAEYVHLFRVLFGRNPSADGMAAALAAYQRTLVSAETRFERYLRRPDPRILNPLERDGYAIFDRRANCSNCHSLPARQPEFWRGAPLLLTDFQFHNLGIGYRSGRFTDPGRFAVTRLRQDLGAFRTPSLRNLRRTAPYMHDGSLATLEEVVDFYDGGGRRNPNLSRLIRPLLLNDYEKAALVAFLRCLDDPAYDQVGAMRHW
jgi:cytochrome c peroxidase